MPKRQTPRPVRWSAEEEEYLRTRVIKDGIHPFDVMLEINEKFKTGRTEASLVKKCQRSGINYDGYATEENKALAKELSSKPAAVKKAIKEDVARSKLQEKLTIYESKYKFLVKEKSLGDKLVGILKEEAQALPKVKLAWKPPVEGVSKEEAVLLLGDFHLGEKVDAAEVYGFGEYNFDIFVRRLKFLAESIKSVTIKKLKGYQVDTLHIFGMGDMVSGIIHEELKENSEEMIFQMLSGAYVTAQFVLELKHMFSKIYIDGVLGNHGRIQKKKYYKKHYTNYDFVFYQFLSTFLAANDDIKCNFPKSFFLIKKIYDWNFLVLHGDSIRSWMGIPWYGIERAMWRLGDLLQGKGINIQYRILGHFHNTGELDRVPGEIIINGSLIGGTEYSLKRFLFFDRPTQLFFGVNERIGVVWRYPLRLDLPGVDEVEPYGYNRDLQAGEYMKDFLKKEK